MSLGQGHRIVQIHPSLRCNLHCKHCYSSSAPDANTGLRPEVLTEALSDAAALGYEVLSVSGGEPLLYSGIEGVLKHAKQLGMRTGLVTNGATLSQERARALAPLCDAVAVSLDGPMVLHNAIRGWPHSFDRAVSALDNLARAGITTAVIHTATRPSLPYLENVAAIAADHGAELLRLHPLESYGRAVELMAAETLRREDRNRLFIQALALEAFWAGAMEIEVDLVLRSQLMSQPDAVYADVPTGSQSDGVELVDTLVIGADGTVVPVAYGIDYSYRVCDLRQGPLRSGWRDFVENRYEIFLNLCHSLWLELSERPEEMVINWNEEIVARSQHEARNRSLAANELV